MIEYYDVLDNLKTLYEKKNADYGDSFNKLLDEFGLVSVAIRLQDKVNRLKSIVKSKEQKVVDETIEDTLMDIANYAIMTVARL